MKSAAILAPVIVPFVLLCQTVFGGPPPQWQPGAASEFEVGTQLRPWTIQDEGIDTILDNCQSMAGVNNIYLIVIMHEEHRPFQAKKFPHNPVRETFMAEDSTVAWFPDMKRYGKIKPRLSEYDWIRETDWLKLTIDACRKRGLGVGAEISHFPMPKAMLTKDSMWVQRNVHGDPVSRPRFCCHHPDVRQYILGLFGDLAANYDLDYIQTCQYLGGECFCEHCIRAAKELGFDMEAAIPVLRKNKDAEPYREQYRKFRREANTRFLGDIAETIRKENPKCHLRLNDVYSWGGHDPYAKGYDFKAIGPHLGSMVNQDHQEQKGRPDEDFAHRKAWLAYNRRCLGPDTPLLSGIAARMRATPELVRRGIKEVEAMELDGYAQFDEELAEEWGVQTSAEGTASFAFDLPSGTYDVRITHFDGPVGQSEVKLSISGKEKASFKLDEDCNCWRWRRFDNIAINTGDRVTLTGKADRDDLARLDFVEFIKK